MSASLLPARLVAEQFRQGFTDADLGIGPSARQHALYRPPRSQYDSDLLAFANITRGTMNAPIIKRSVVLNSRKTSIGAAVLVRTQIDCGREEGPSWASNLDDRCKQAAGQSLVRAAALRTCEVSPRGCASGSPPPLRTMTPADFYRGEAARCRQRAERSSTPERAEKWEARAEQYLRLASKLDGTEQQSLDAAMPTRGSRRASGAFLPEQDEAAKQGQPGGDEGD